MKSEHAFALIALILGIVLDIVAPKIKD